MMQCAQGCWPWRAARGWNPEQRRHIGMGPEELGEWFDKLLGLTSPLRREFHLLTLLTGSWPTALKTVRIEHVDFKRRLLHIPQP